MLRKTAITLFRGLASVVRLVAAPRSRRRRAEVGLAAYRGFGSEQRVCFIGRVSEDMSARGDQDDGRDKRRRMLRRLRDAYRLLVSRPAPPARIEVEYR